MPRRSAKGGLLSLVGASKTRPVATQQINLSGPRFTLGGGVSPSLLDGPGLVVSGTELAVNTGAGLGIIGDAVAVTGIGTGLLNVFGTGTANALEWGAVEGGSSDTNLYRSAPDTLRTDDALAVLKSITIGNGIDFSDNLLISGALASSYGVFEAGLTTLSKIGYSSYLNPTDSYNRFQARADGKLEWGPGTTTQDANLYRSSANGLKTDGWLWLGGGMQFSATDYINSPGAGVIRTASRFDSMPAGLGNIAFLAGDPAGGGYWFVTNSGDMFFGDGTGVYDTRLYRAGANLLQTDDSFIASGNIQAGGYIYSSTLLVGMGITANRTFNVANGAGIAWLDALKWISDTEVGTGTLLKHSAYGFDARSQKLTSLAAGNYATPTDAPNMSQVPSAGQLAALAGSHGTPGSGDRYVTQSDPLFNLVSHTLPELMLALSPLLYVSLGAGGSGLTDQGSGAHNGTAQGGVTIGGGGSISSDGGASTDFDGVNDYVSFAYNPFAGQKTFVGWFQRDTTTGAHALFGGTNVQLWIQSGARQHVLFGDIGAAQWSDAWPGTGRPVAWALTYDAAAQKAELYINGISKGKVGVNAYVSGTGNLNIGALGTPANFADGKGAHFAIYNTILPASSIAQLAEVGIGHAPGRDYGLMGALPTDALPGDKLTYIADATNGIFWSLIYDGNGTYPWKYVGGPPLETRVDTQQSRANVAYGALTGPLSLVNPLAGDWDAEIEAVVQSAGSNQEAFLSYTIGATAANDNWAAQNYASTAVVVEGTSVCRTRQTGIAAAQTWQEQAKEATGGTMKAKNRRLRLTPVRVG